MLDKLFQELVQHFTKQENVGPTRLPWTTDSKTVLFWDPNQKDVRQTSLTPPDTRHKLLTVNDVIALAMQLDKKTEEFQVIWVSDDKIVLEYSTGSDGNLAVMDLKKTPFYEKLEELEEDPSLSQFDAIRFVRQFLHDFAGGDVALNQIRNLRITKKEEFESKQAPTTNRLSKSVQQDAAGAGELPEYIDAEVLVFEGTDPVSIDLYEIPVIRLWLSIDFETGNILFEPDVFSLRHAINAERTRIKTRIATALKETETLVYEGEYQLKK